MVLHCWNQQSKMALEYLSPSQQGGVLWYLAGQEVDLGHGAVLEFGQDLLQCLGLWVPAGAVQVESAHQHAILRWVRTLALPHDITTSI